MISYERIAALTDQGLGNMGSAMATNLQKHLAKIGETPLHYTNRTMSRGASLLALGAIPCNTVVDVVRKANIVFISVCMLLGQGEQLTNGR